MGINAKQFRELVVRPTLEYLEPTIPYSQEAEDLLMMTAAHESRLGAYLKQVNGPALGVYQVEPATHKDIWRNFLSFDKKVHGMLMGLTSGDEIYSDSELVTNLAYATAIARVHYWRVPRPLPQREEYEDYSEYLWALADYAKAHYNTYKGKATSEDYFDAFLDFSTELDKG